MNIEYWIDFLDNNIKKDQFVSIDPRDRRFLFKTIAEILRDWETDRIDLITALSEAAAILQKYERNMM